MRIFEKNNRITVFVAGALVTLSIIALSISIFIANDLQNEIAEKQLKILNERTEIENRTFFKELNTSLKMVAGLVVSGVFQETEVDKWSSGIQPVLLSNLNITAVSITNMSGSEYVVSLSDSLLSYYLIKDKNESRATYYTRNLSNDSIQAISAFIATKAINLDSYKNHILKNSDSIVWYGFQAIPGTKKMAGYAASVKTMKKKESEDLAISIYVSLDRLQHFLKTNANIVNGELFLFTKDLKFLDFENESIDTLNSNLSDYLVSWDKVKSPLYKEAMLVGAKVEIGDSVGFQSFKYDNRKYWGAFRSTKRGDNNLRIALIVPEDDFFMILKGRLGYLFFSAILVLLFSAVFLTFSLRRNLLKDSTREYLETEDILKLIKNGEDEFAEFKSTVRMNLFSKKPGKEIELAWLKSVVAFCNTKGGAILIGVNDDGEILGLEADNFQNDDKCLLHIQSLLKDHIGMEFTKYINYKLHTLVNKKILAVHCTPSPEPLFLISNNKEQFYVRSGPASIELPTSKALKYIETRKLVK